MGVTDEDDVKKNVVLDIETIIAFDSIPINKKSNRYDFDVRIIGKNRNFRSVSAWELRGC